MIFASPDELAIPIDPDLLAKLQQRKKKCIHYFDGSESHYVTGIEVDSFMHDIVKQKKVDVERLYGRVANPGKVEGIARVLFTKDDFLKFKKGDILVAPCTRPEFLPIMEKAAAILTDEGGITSHAAIISRELGKPCIIGLQHATDDIKDGMHLLVNANHGIVEIKK